MQQRLDEAESRLQELEFGDYEDAAEEWEDNYEWDLSEFDFSTYNAGDSETSPEFGLRYNGGLALRYWPNWDVGNMSSFLKLIKPPNVKITCRLYMDDTPLETKENTDGSVVGFPWLDPKAPVKSIWVELIDEFGEQPTLKPSNTTA